MKKCATENCVWFINEKHPTLCIWCQCHAEGCTNSNELNGKNCALHKCKMCTNDAFMDKDLCLEHVNSEFARLVLLQESACKFGLCDEKVGPEEMFCRHHRCIKKRCTKKREDLGDNLGLAYYCHTHKCLKDDCLQGKSHNLYSGGYCRPCHNNKWGNK